MARSFSITIAAGLAASVVLSASAHADSFTFIVWSDAHYGYANELGYRDNCISDINGLAGKAYPAPFVGLVDTPAFVLLPGDITEDGWLSEWENTTPSTNDDYVSGRALVNCPVYEAMGNHDHQGDNIIQQKFIEEHGHSWYAFDHGGVHFVVLDSIDANEEPYFGTEQLDWLAADLAGVGTTQPVIVALHCPPFDELGDQYAALGDTLTGYNICLILAGHIHQTGYYVWRGWDVWVTGDTKMARGNPYSTISAVHIARGRLQAISYNWFLDGWYPDIYLDKPVTGVPPGAPRIALYPKVVNLETTYGITPAPGTFTVTNVGDLTLDYTIYDDADWLTVAPEDGSSTGESDTIQVACDVAGLGLGPHVATIRVEDIDASNSPQPITVNLTVKPVPGDFDADMDRDQADFGHLQACLTGSGVPQNDANCQDAKLDGDADVDQEDARMLLRCLTGPGFLPDPHCVGH